MLLAEMKTGNNSHKLKNEIRQILYLLYQHKKSPKECTTTSSSHYNHERRYDCDKRYKNFLF